MAEVTTSNNLGPFQLASSHQLIKSKQEQQNSPVQHSNSQSHKSLSVVKIEHKSPTTPIVDAMDHNNLNQVQGMGKFKT